MTTRLYVGLGSMHRTYEDARTGRNPLTQSEVDEILAANNAETDRIQEARASLACPACGRIGERKLPARGPQGEADVLICATISCYRQWKAKKLYLDNR
jgi:hypothetical protein